MLKYNPIFNYQQNAIAVRKPKYIFSDNNILSSHLSNFNISCCLNCVSPSKSSYVIIKKVCHFLLTFKYDCYISDLFCSFFSDWWSRNSHTLFLLCFLFYCTKWYSPQLECVIFDAFSPALCGRAIARSSLWRNIRCFFAFLVVANNLLLWLRVSFH